VQNLRHSAVKDRPVNQINRDFHDIRAVTSDVSSSVDRLVKVDVVILDCDKSNQMCPGWHSEIASDEPTVAWKYAGEDITSGLVRGRVFYGYHVNKGVESPHLCPASIFGGVPG
jgi:hypothetical protein